MFARTPHRIDPRLRPLRFEPMQRIRNADGDEATFACAAEGAVLPAIVEDGVTAEEREALARGGWVDPLPPAPPQLSPQPLVHAPQGDDGSPVRDSDPPAAAWGAAMFALGVCAGGAIMFLVIAASAWRR